MGFVLPKTPLTMCAVLVCAAIARGAGNASLCVQSEPGCLTPGGTEVLVHLGASDRRIVAGQFAISYDPSRLTFVDALPGRICDPASPFALELFQSADSSTGLVVFAVGINFLEGTGGTLGPATVACIRFVPTVGEAGQSGVCLTELSNGLTSLLVDDTARPVEVDNHLDCPAGVPAPVLSCTSVVIEENCQCVPGTADCHGLDTDCRLGVCNDTTRFCEITSVNEAGPCDDGDDCTIVDRCEDGLCDGSGCVRPSLCMNTDTCVLADMPIRAVVTLGSSDRPIAGAQFSIEYDAEGLDLIDVSPGVTCDPESPFTTEVQEFVDEVGGHIFYAVGVTLGGGGSTLGPATLACLTFVPRYYPAGEVCLVQNSNPLINRLVDQTGQSVPIGDSSDCPDPRQPPVLSCIGFEEVCIIPTVSHWGLLVTALLILIGAKIRFGVGDSAFAVPRPPGRG